MRVCFWYRVWRESGRKSCFNVFKGTLQKCSGKRGGKVSFDFFAWCSVSRTCNKEQNCNLEKTGKAGRWVAAAFLLHSNTGCYTSDRSAHRCVVPLETLC